MTTKEINDLISLMANTTNMNTLKDSIFSLEKERQSFQESIAAIKEYINGRDEIHTVPYNARIDSIRAKFNQMVKDCNKYIKRIINLRNGC